MIFRYILKEYFKYVIAIISISVFLFMLFDFIHKSTGYFVKHDPSTTTILKYYFFSIPSQFLQALPLAGLFASVISMILLQRSNEITAMRAAGMGPINIALPIIFGGLVFSLMALSLSELLIPKFAKKMHFVESVLIEGQEDKEINDKNNWIRSANKLIYFEKYSSSNNSLQEPFIIKLDEDFRLQAILSAKLANYSKTNKKWQLQDSKTLRFNHQGNPVKIINSKTKDINIPITPSNINKEKRVTSELRISEINSLIMQGEEIGADVNNLKVDLHLKFAYAFATFIVSLIGIKFAYSNERNSQTVRGILFAFLIGIAYWFILSACKALGNRGAINPFLAAWLANIIVFIITITGLWRTLKLKT